MRLHLSHRNVHMGIRGHVSQTGTHQTQNLGTVSTCFDQNEEKGKTLSRLNEPTNHNSPFSFDMFRPFRFPFLSEAACLKNPNPSASQPVDVRTSSPSSEKTCYKLLYIYGYVGCLLDVSYRWAMALFAKSGGRTHSHGKSPAQKPPERKHLDSWRHHSHGPS